MDVDAEMSMWILWIVDAHSVAEDTHPLHNS